MADINQVQLPDGSQYNIKDDVSGYATETYVQNQISGITKATIGLGNVDNTSDANKPVSTAQQTALNGKTNTSVIAYTESSATATKRYEVGDQFILNGVLYTATAIIANAGTIEVGTNCSASDTVTTQIDTVKASDATKANKSDLASISITGTTNNTGATIYDGTNFYLNNSLVRAIADIANGATLTNGTNYLADDGALNKFTKIVYDGTFTTVGSYVDVNLADKRGYKFIECYCFYNNNSAVGYAKIPIRNGTSAEMVISPRIVSGGNTFEIAGSLRFTAVGQFQFSFRQSGYGVTPDSLLVIATKY